MEQDIYTIIDQDDTETDMEAFELAEAEWELKRIASIWKDAPFIKDFISNSQYGI